MEIYSPGDVVTAKITSMTKYGAFARLKEGIEGLIHISTIKFRNMLSRIDEYLKIDQCVQVRILHIEKDKKTNWFKLGVIWKLNAAKRL